MLHVHLPRRKRHERNKSAVPPPHRIRIQKTRACHPPLKFPERPLLVVEKRVEVRLRKHGKNFLQHAFRAAVLIQVIVEDGDFHMPVGSVKKTSTVFTRIFMSLQSETCSR